MKWKILLITKPFNLISIFCRSNTFSYISCGWYKLNRSWDKINPCWTPLLIVSSSEVRLHSFIWDYLFALLFILTRKLLFLLISTRGNSVFLSHRLLILFLSFLWIIILLVPLVFLNMEFLVMSNFQFLNADFTVLGINSMTLIFLQRRDVLRSS